MEILRETTASEIILCGDWCNALPFNWWVTQVFGGPVDV